VASGRGKQRGTGTVADRVARLTPSERAVVEAMLDGRAPADVARALGRSEPDLHGVLGAVQEKLDAGSMLSAMAMVLIAQRKDGPQGRRTRDPARARRPRQDSNLRPAD
jgi:DNA-binding CsgD family transcriptional regulator